MVRPILKSPPRLCTCRLPSFLIHDPPSVVATVGGSISASTLKEILVVRIAAFMGRESRHHQNQEQYETKQRGPAAENASENHVDAWKTGY